VVKDVPRDHHEREAAGSVVARQESALDGGWAAQGGERCFSLIRGDPEKHARDHARNTEVNLGRLVREARGEQFGRLRCTPPGPEIGNRDPIG